MISKLLDTYLLISRRLFLNVLNLLYQRVYNVWGINLWGDINFFNKCLLWVTRCFTSIRVCWRKWVRGSARFLADLLIFQVLGMTICFDVAFKWSFSPDFGVRFIDLIIVLITWIVTKCLIRCGCVFVRSTSISRWWWGNFV